ncbi:MAG TPA: TadE family protein [Ilumatobacter sp.]|nr:TadE family protein [Ilumatobacter sp.]
MNTHVGARGRVRGDAGMTTVQLTVLFPVVLFWLMLIVQFGLWWHAKQVANGAAAEAVTAARTPSGTDLAGEQAALGYLAESGNLSHVEVEVTRDGEVVVAIISGHAPRLVPGFAWSVTAVSQAAVERFVPAGER